MRNNDLKGPIKDIITHIWFYVKTNAFAIISITQFSLPYIILLVGTQYSSGNKLLAVISITIAQVVLLYLKALLNRKGKGANVPIPNSRFTKVDGYGEVSIERERLQELIIYMCDLEDYFERTGMSN